MSRRANHRGSLLPCACLMDALRGLDIEAEYGLGCTAVDCPVRTLDKLTLRRFLEAIAAADGPSASDTVPAGERPTLPIYRPIFRRRRQR